MGEVHADETPAVRGKKDGIPAGATSQIERVAGRQDRQETLEKRSRFCPFRAVFQPVTRIPIVGSGRHYDTLGIAVAAAILPDGMLLAARCKSDAEVGIVPI
ncbi:MAG TPA: hypothetical protein VKE24_14960 [Candidatus Acidoferrales bacterium]|nr:hypothetical protein [Candidatus Acidoferrales bacterium]